MMEDIELEIDFGDSDKGEDELELEIDFNEEENNPKDETRNPFSETKDIKTSSFGAFQNKKGNGLGISEKDEIDLKFKDYKILHPYVAKLQIKDVSLNNNLGIKNRYYLIKVLVKGEDEIIGFFAKWGKVGGDSDYLFESAQTTEEAILKFKAKFLEKTFNDWDNKENFNPVVGGYTMLGIDEIETEQGGDDSGVNRDINQRRFLEKLELIDKKIIMEISQLNYEIALVLRELFSVTGLSEIMSEIGVDRLKLGMENLKTINITGAHQVLCDLQEELTGKSKRFNRIFELSDQFDKYIPLLRRKSTVNLIDDVEKLKIRFMVVEHLRDIITSVELFRAIEMKSGAEKNPIDLIYSRLNTHLEKVERESEAYELVLQMMTTHGENHNAFELELKDVFYLKNEEQDVSFYPFRKLERKLLWLGGRNSKISSVLK